ncbi:YidH family protein [Granulicoccus sp. GXG6511]|uniref:YidH family protein n=1 Tax=Granulicoccus sp. GXG6511 TaxID=3381351 RepID=UPI003D7D66BA
MAERGEDGADASVWDVGLQPERTRLAWQRTSLALLTAGLVVARFVGHHHATIGVAAAAAAAFLAGATGVASTRRYRNANRRLDLDRPLQGGLVPLLMTLAFLVVGIGAAIYVLVS